MNAHAEISHRVRHARHLVQIFDCYTLSTHLRRLIYSKSCEICRLVERNACPIVGNDRLYALVKSLGVVHHLDAGVWFLDRCIKRTLLMPELIIKPRTSEEGPKWQAVAFPYNYVLHTSQWHCGFHSL